MIIFEGFIDERNHIFLLVLDDVLRNLCYM